MTVRPLVVLGHSASVLVLILVFSTFLALDGVDAQERAKNPTPGSLRQDFRANCRARQALIFLPIK